MPLPRDKKFESLWLTSVKTRHPLTWRYFKTAKPNASKVWGILSRLLRPWFTLLIKLRSSTIRVAVSANVVRNLCRESYRTEKNSKYIDDITTQCPNHLQVDLILHTFFTPFLFSTYSKTTETSSHYTFVMCVISIPSRTENFSSLKV